MSYASASDVAAIVGEGVIFTDADYGGTGASNFASDTNPSLTVVNTWLNVADQQINAVLATRGYTVPVGSDIAFYPFLTITSALYAAWRAEDRQISATISIEERTRGELRRKEYLENLDMLKCSKLSELGLTYNTHVKITGQSKTDKEELLDDSDLVQPSFRKDQFDYN
jgi:hypothetical protein